jgi:hypothetical protein
MVRTGRLELPCLAAVAPKATVSANSTTLAHADSTNLQRVRGAGLVNVRRHDFRG